MKRLIQLYAWAIGFLIVLATSLEVIARHRTTLAWVVVIAGLVMVGRVLWRRTAL